MQLFLTLVYQIQEFDAFHLMPLINFCRNLLYYYFLEERHFSAPLPHSKNIEEKGRKTHKKIKILAENIFKKDFQKVVFFRQTL